MKLHGFSRRSATREIIALTPKDFSVGEEFGDDVAASKRVRLGTIAKVNWTSRVAKSSRRDSDRTCKETGGNWRTRYDFPRVLL